MKRGSELRKGAAMGLAGMLLVSAASLMSCSLYSASLENFSGVAVPPKSPKCVGEFCYEDVCAEELQGFFEDLADVEAKIRVLQAQRQCSSAGCPVGQGIGGVTLKEKDLQKQASLLRKHIESLDGTYQECCRKRRGDPGFGVVSLAGHVTVVLKGHANAPINGIGPRTAEIPGVKFGFLGCYHDTVAMASQNFEFSALPAVIHFDGLTGDGSCVAASWDSQMGAMTFTIEFDVAVTLGDSSVDLGNDRIRATISTETEEGERFELAQNGKAFGKLGLESITPTTSQGAFTSKGVNITMLTWTIEDLDPYFLISENQDD